MKPQCHLALLLCNAFLLCGCDQPKQIDSIASDRPSANSEMKKLQEGRKMKVVSVTEAASEKMKTFLNGDQRSYIRLAVKNDGPTGFMYDLKIDDVKPNEFDIVDESNGFLLITDSKARCILTGQQSIGRLDLMVQLDLNLTIQTQSKMTFEAPENANEQNHAPKLRIGRFLMVAKLAATR